MAQALHEGINSVRLSEAEPLGFRLDEYRVDVRGLCPARRPEK